MKLTGKTEQAAAWIWRLTVLALLIAIASELGVLSSAWYGIRRATHDMFRVGPEEGPAPSPQYQPFWDQPDWQSQNPARPASTPWPASSRPLSPR